jgi:hypothetical protein
VSIKQLKVVAGTGGRNKLISITDLDESTVHKKILDHID